jgi:hypothetical protein
MGLFKRKCGYESASPFRVKCSRELGTAACIPPGA